MTTKKKSTVKTGRKHAPRRFYINLATDLAVAGLATRHMVTSKFTLRGWQDYLVKCNAAEHVAAGYAAHSADLPSYLQSEMLMMTMARLRDYRHTPEQAAEMITAAREKRARKLLREAHQGALGPLQGAAVPGTAGGTQGGLESTVGAPAAPAMGI